MPDEDQQQASTTQGLTTLVNSEPEEQYRKAIMDSRDVYDSEFGSSKRTQNSDGVYEDNEKANRYDAISKQIFKDPQQKSGTLDTGETWQREKDGSVTITSSESSVEYNNAHTQSWTEVNTHTESWKKQTDGKITVNQTNTREIDGKKTTSYRGSETITTDENGEMTVTAKDDKDGRKKTTDLVYSKDGLSTRTITETNGAGAETSMTREEFEAGVPKQFTHRTPNGERTEFFDDKGQMQSVDYRNASQSGNLQDTISSSPLENPDGTYSWHLTNTKKVGDAVVITGEENFVEKNGEVVSGTKWMQNADGTRTDFHREQGKWVPDGQTQEQNQGVQPQQGTQPNAQPQQDGQQSAQPQQGTQQDGQPGAQPQQNGQPSVQPQQDGQPSAQPQQDGQPAPQDQSRNNSAPAGDHYSAALAAVSGMRGLVMDYGSDNNARMQLVYNTDHMVAQAQNVNQKT